MWCDRHKALMSISRMHFAFLLGCVPIKLIFDLVLDVSESTHYRPHGFVGFVVLLDVCQHVLLFVHSHLGRRTLHPLDESLCGIIKPVLA